MRQVRDPGVLAPELAPVARPIDRITRPHYAVWELTLGCNLSCHHCSSRAAAPGPMSSPPMRRAASSARWAISAWKRSR